MISTRQLSHLWIRSVDEIGKPKHEYESCAIPEQMFEAMKQIVYSRRDGGVAVFTDEKQTT